MDDAVVCAASGCTLEPVKGIAFLCLVEGKVEVKSLCQTHIERLDGGYLPRQFVDRGGQG